MEVGMMLQHLGLVEAKVLRPSDCGLWGRRQVLTRLAPRLYLRVDALQHLCRAHRACHRAEVAKTEGFGLRLSHREGFVTVRDGKRYNQQPSLSNKQKSTPPSSSRCRI